MLKKNVWLVIFVLFSFSALGGALFYHHSAQKQRNENMTIQNPIGDPRLQSEDFKEATPPPNTPEAPESEGGSAVATAPDNGAAIPPDNSAATTRDNSTATAPDNSAATSTDNSTPAAPDNSLSGAESGGIKPNARQQPASGGGDPLRSQIEQKYIARLQSLASGYEGKLNGLVSAALSEYSAAKKDNPNADISPLVNKYYSAGKALEAECDSKFYSVLAAFESELSAHSFPLDAAVRAKETYEARKSARAGQITSGKP